MRSCTVLSQFQKTLANLICRQFINRAKTSVAQMVDIIDNTLAITQPDDIFDRLEEILRPQRHFVFIDIQIEFTIQAESADPAKTYRLIS